jgi:hypothetical protein
MRNIHYLNSSIVLNILLFIQLLDKCKRPFYSMNFLKETIFNKHSSFSQKRKRFLKVTGLKP